MGLPLFLCAQAPCARFLCGRNFLRAWAAARFFQLRRELQPRQHVVPHPLEHRSQRSQRLPPGAIPTIVAFGPHVHQSGVRECVGCHSPHAFTTRQHTRQEWTAIVTRMGGPVKSATRPELETVAKYLASNFPRVEDTNKVNVHQEAAAVVEFRTKHGNFRESGVNGRKVQAAKDRMSF